MKRHGGVLLCVAMACVLGCSSMTNQEISTSADEAAIAGRVDRPARVRNLEVLAADVRDTDYRIGPEDLLEISFFELEDLHKSQTVTVRVSEQGEVMLPLLGNVPVKGQTTGELRREIEKRLAQKYITEPQVNVSIREYKSKKVTVLGAVKQPGVYKLTRNQSTLLHVLGLAGGPTEQAGRTLYLVRGGRNGTTAPADAVLSSAVTVEVPPGTPPTGRGVRAIDLEDLLERGHGELNLTIESGDVVNIPEAGRVYVTGHVNNAGGFPLRQKMTVLQALSLAGGLKKTAEPTQARVVRRVDGREETVPVNLARIAEGKAPDVVMRENDVLQVPDNALRNFGRGALQVFGSIFSIGVGL